MKLPSDQKFFVFDCESLGLHGEHFAVAGGTYNINGKAIEGSEFAFHCDKDTCIGSPAQDDEQVEQDSAWVDANVTISTTSIELPHSSKVCQAFWGTWEIEKHLHPGILVFAECLWPVEGRFLNECIMAGENLNWSGPYPMHEIATLMLAAGMDPMATYERRENELPAHEPLADARLSARLLSEAITRLQAMTEAVDRA